MLPDGCSGMNSPAQGLFLSGDSWVHRLNPLTRLTYLLAGLPVVFIGPGGAWPALTLCMATLLLAGAAGCLGVTLRRLAAAWLPLALAMALVHGLFGPGNHTLLAQWGPVSLGREGLQYAGVMAARLAAALTASLVVVQTTAPRLLMTALTQAGWPAWAVYLLGSPLLLLPQVERRAHAIRAAQQARGFETEGSRVRRIQAVLPLVAPLIFSLLVEVEERALALEIRAFNAAGPKTSLVQVDDPRHERIARRVMLTAGGLIAAAGVGLRVHGG